MKMNTVVQFITVKKLIIFRYDGEVCGDRGKKVRKAQEEAELEVGEREEKGSEQCEKLPAQNQTSQL